MVFSSLQLIVKDADLLLMSSCPQSRTSSLPRCEYSHTRQIDIPHARIGLIIDHRNTDIRLSDGLWLHRRVRQLFFMLFITLHVVDFLAAWGTQTSREVLAPSQMPSACPLCTWPTSSIPRRRAPLYL